MKKNKNNLKLYQYEQEAWKENLSLCGVDEVGRGCLAGPVVTATAILFPHVFHPDLIDSKLLDKKTLQTVYGWLIKNSLFTIAINSNRTIDQHNIYQTTAITMKQALLNLLHIAAHKPKIILIDAIPISLQNTPYQDIQCISLIKGESKSASIAAASILAKVTRDNILQRLHTSFPAYNMHNHKGYATKNHQDNLSLFQPSIIHRQTFIKKLVQKDYHEQKSIFC